MIAAAAKSVRRGRRGTRLGGVAAAKSLRFGRRGTRLGGVVATVIVLDILSSRGSMA
jgi:hypothetical protein